ncbi:hypothetical protein [Clostridium saccharobutylicum]|uniref:Uncharacterized protein n=1 Tax=Clostridium saccharobutylicum DSM 13864 TaxID=1345695 RepID=U5MT82_CLOSA|nr:hypothetical protein [Clostridium saccharobutylicum]AGX42657.1 hypothetical protein CLSA_c16600 [Clostridium saccharobutylicum DSM 13864]AQR89945.1 hypothetical protein CLOSC_16520 [Clostridium saccharobutylicum]AQR99850.1 hypothetical protein CSACC_16590 [Clostridium saccharobutylicum]AQS09578.1 hypothetical protein CLOBY_17070 [Clostridium saccharobutylicum]AQS13834.1 hypothetical protein CLOSACC_16590 [Clostridium saccharobutylicum]
MYNKNILDKFNKEEIIIIPDSEIFVSYKSNPLFVLILSQFGKLKNEISSNDYFLIFDISASGIKNSDIGDYAYDDFFGMYKDKL